MTFGSIFTRAIFALPVFAFSNFSYAVCPPIIGCKVTAEASTIAGSNADQELITFAQNITTSSNEVATALVDMANANASSLNAGAQSLISAQMELSQIKIGQKLKVEKAMSDRDMAHKTQLVENAYRNSATVVSSDDTKEEFQLIIDYLGDNPDLSVPEIILVLQETMDNDDDLGFVMVPIKSAEGTCSASDIEESGDCAIPKRIFPAKKLQALYQQCSVDKRILKETEAKTKSRVAAIQVSNKATSKALDTTNSTGAITSRMSKQIQLSCTPNQFKNNLCSVSTPEEYQESIVTGNIIPNGDLSASNFSTPSYVASNGYIDDIGTTALKQIEGASLDRQALVDAPNQKVVAFTHTYRNANQVKAAMNFIDNVVADDLTPALSPSDRRKSQNAEYQSRFLSQTAARSAVRAVLYDHMTQRVGTKMRELILNGTMESTDKFDIATDSNDNKESVLGAGALDILEDRVGNQSSSLQLAGQNASGSVNNDFVTAPSETGAMEQILSSMQLQNEMLKTEILMLEQSNMLEAVAVAQKANSPAMAKLMSDLRRGR